MRIAQLLQQGFQQYAEPVMLFLKVVHDDEDCPDDCLKAAAGVLGYAPSQSGTRVEALPPSPPFARRDLAHELGPVVQHNLGQPFVMGVR